MARNVGASVQAKLKNVSKERGVDMSALLRRYAQERLLYRLSVSPEADNFCVKGGLLLSAYNGGDLLRPTEDVDFNGFDPESDVATVEAALRRVLAVDVEDDGVTFLPETITVHKDRTGRIPGGKLALQAMVHTSRVDVRVDVGFGNPVTPGVRRMVMPTLLPGDVPQPEVLAYPLETVIAEKVHAMAQFGLLNTRVKDYWDVWMLSKTHEFDGGTVAEAIVRTFEAQDREIPETLEGLGRTYADEQSRAWKAFLKRIGAEFPADFAEVVDDVSAFVEPAVQAGRSGTAFDGRWHPDSGWSSPSPRP